MTPDSCNDCPACGRAFPEAIKVAAQPYCECGWVGPISEPPIRLPRRFKFILAGLFCGCVLLLSLYFFGRSMYGDSMVRALWLHSLTTLHISSEDQERSLGRLCNTYYRYSCSANIYARLHERQPDNFVVLANLAMAQTEIGKHSEAVEAYAVYFEHGQSATDVMLGYGRSLEALGRDLEARSWYYNTVIGYPSSLEGYTRLVTLLARRGDHAEALSVVNGAMRNRPNLRKYLKARALALEEALEKKTGSSRKSIRSVALSKNDMHYVPVGIPQSSGFRSFLVDTGATYFTLSTEVAKRWGITLSDEAERVELHTGNGIVSAQLVTIPHLQVGPWIFENVRAAVRANASLLLGQSAMSHLELSLSSEKGRRVMTIRRKF